MLLISVIRWQFN